MLKILYHHRTQADDAQGIHIYEMVNAFRELGHEVHMVALVEKDIEADTKTKGAKWEAVANAVPNWLYELLELFYNIVGFWGLVRSIRKNRPDFIYERYSLNTFCGVWASKLFNIPILLEVNAPLYREQKKLGKLVFERFARFSERWICSNATRTITVTQVMKDLLAEQGVPVEKMVVMHNGINPKRFSIESDDGVRDQYSLTGCTVIGFVGWFRPWHGVDNLIHIFHSHNFAALNAKLLLVGEGPAFADLNQIVDQYTLKEHVIFTGAVEKKEISSYINAMDIAVQPKVTDYACPMKILEYMAMGKCIVAPNQANICELLDDGKTGLLFQPGVRDDFARALTLLLHDENLRRSIGENAKQAIQQRGLLWSVNAERCIELVQSA